MDKKMEQNHENEIVRLNLEDLDVAELEQRLEMASSLPNADCWADACGIDLA